MVAQTQKLTNMKQFVVLPQRNNNPFSKDYIKERAETVFGTREDAEKTAKSLAIQYHGIIFHVYETVVSFETEMKVS